LRTVKLSPGAGREFRKLSRDVQVRLASRIDALAGDPRPAGTERLTDEENLYRIREGDFRIVYQIRDVELVVIVVALGDRKDIYRRFK
jgi:mRNA interferase RelE/StbE